MIGLRGPRSFDDNYSLVPPTVFGSIGGKLGPWFWLDHPTKGGKGPWSKCDQEVKRLGLDVAAIWARGDERLYKAVGRAVEGETWAEAYWTARSASP